MRASANISMAITAHTTLSLRPSKQAKIISKTWQLVKTIPEIHIHCGRYVGHEPCASAPVKKKMVPPVFLLVGEKLIHSSLDSEFFILFNVVFLIIGN